MSRKRIVIIGGGFGGIAVAKQLKRSEVDIVLIDRQNYHLFQPLLYQVGTAGLSPANIAWPIRSIFRKQKNLDVLMAEVGGVNLERQVVEHNFGSTRFDELVIATGMTHGWFGHPEWAEHAIGLKELSEATEIRNRILSEYERAETVATLSGEPPEVCIVVIGGGATGLNWPDRLLSWQNEFCRRTLEILSQIIRGLS